MKRLLFGLIEVAARLVPADRRDRWRREWRAEVHHALLGSDDRKDFGPLRVRLLLRTCGAFLDAAWLRVDALRFTDVVPRIGRAFRGLLRAPRFSVPVVLTLAVSIGACTALFSVAYGVLLRPLPFPEPDRLMTVRGEARAIGASRLPVDAPDVAMLRERSSALDGVSFVRTVSDGVLTGAGDARSIDLARVTTDFFDVLDVDAALGRTFRPGDGHLTPEEADRDDDDLSPLPPTVVLLSDGLWRQRFGGDRDVLGRTVRIDGNPAVVVGVMPPGFRMPLPPGSGVPARVDAWTPVRFDLGLLRRTERLEDQDSRNGGIVVARLRGGVSPDALTGELDAVSREIRARSPSYADAGFRLSAQPLREALGRRARPTLVALLGAAGLALLIACLNVAGLLYARSLARERERAVRAAMGAGRGTLVREALVEVGLLAALGGAAGVALAVIATPRLLSVVPASIPRLEAVGVNLPVLLFAGGVTLGALLLSGLLPAVRASRVEASEALTTRAASGGTSDVRARAVLVAGQLALVTALLAGSVLLVRSVQNLSEVDPGFSPRGVLAFDLDLTFRDGYRGPADRARFLRTLRERLSGLPEVEAVAATGALPLDDRRFVQPYALPGQGPLEADADRRANFRVVTRDYFRTVGTRLLSGRSFIPADDDQDRRVAIVDQVLASRISEQGRDPLGSLLRIPVDGEEVSAEIVGVVENVRFEDLRRPGRPTVYVPYRHEASRNVSVLVRTAGPTSSLVAPIRAVLEELDPRLAVHELRSLDQLVSASLAPTRFLLGVFAAFAALALLLSAIGVFGVVAYGVRRRRREIGVRAALGASRQRLLGSTLYRSLAVGAAGVAGGLGLALLASRLVGTVLFDVDPADPVALSTAGVIILATTLLAAWLPARRASRMNPMEVLREE